MNADRNDAKGRATQFQVAQNNPNRACFQRQVARPKRAGAFREDAKIATRTEMLDTVVDGCRIHPPVRFILLARNSDACKENPREPVSKELSRNHEHRLLQRLIINEAIHRAIAVQANEQYWT